MKRLAESVEKARQLCEKYDHHRVNPQAYLPTPPSIVSKLDELLKQLDGLQ